MTTQDEWNGLPEYRKTLPKISPMRDWSVG